MPRVKETIIYFIHNGRRDVLKPTEDIQFTGNIAIVVCMEVQARPVMKKGLIGKAKRVMVPQQVIVPVRAYPLHDIAKIDYGYMDPLAHKEMMARQKKDSRVTQKKQPEGVQGEVIEPKELKPGETYPGEFEEKKDK